jgi:hypothetical protein
MDYSPSAHLGNHSECESYRPVCGKTGTIHETTLSYTKDSYLDSIGVISWIAFASNNESRSENCRASQSRL